MTKLRISGLLGGVLAGSIGLFALAGGCSAANNDNAAIRETTWAITAACNACLKDYCAAAEGEPHPYDDCASDLSCSDRFGDFANCFKRTRSLWKCREEVEALNQTGKAGRQLLQNCFLLDCFDEICEGSGE